jgi:lipoprotein NlpI
MRQFVCLLILGSLAARLPGAEDAGRLLTAGQEALQRNDFEKASDLGKQALALAREEVKKDPRDVRARLLLARAHELLGQHAEAIRACNKVVELDPRAAEVLNLRGSEQFKLGRLAESLADFDRFLKLQPDAFPGHWKRGITLYYLGKYDEGRKQFEGYEKVDTNDVENAVWHFLCVARKDGVKKARASLLAIGKDQRVPMMEVYALFAGKAKPADVLKAAEADRPTASQKNTRLFYAHLYLGLYHEVHGDTALARKHLDEAADNHRVGHYMWDVAHVHHDLLRKNK